MTNRPWPMTDLCVPSIVIYRQYLFLYDYSLLGIDWWAMPVCCIHLHIPVPIKAIWEKSSGLSSLEGITTPFPTRTARLCLGRLISHPWQTGRFCRLEFIPQPGMHRKKVMWEHRKERVTHKPRRKFSEESNPDNFLALDSQSPQLWGNTFLFSPPICHTWIWQL